MSSHAPRIGAKIPQTELTGSIDDIRTYATTIRDLGFDHITSEDHVVGGTPTYQGAARNVFSNELPVQEIFSLFAYVAGIAPELEVASGVLILPQRQTALVAKQVAAIDTLTGGKVRLGVGIGWSELEYVALGETWTTRAGRFEEQIEVLRALWSNSVVDYHGSFHSLDEAGINPRPASGQVPIWIGAAAEPAIRRAARIGDGFILLGRIGEEAERQLETFHDELRRIDRDPVEVGLEGWINLTPHADTIWKRDLDAWTSAGASHVTLVTERLGYRTLEEHLDVLAHGMEVARSL